jgi:hypothetical protein
MDSLEMESYIEKRKLSIELPRKVWNCYESELYNQIMTPLSQLYYLSYVDFASNLKEFIAKKSLLELGIDESWLNDEIATPAVAMKQKFHEHEDQEVSMAIKYSSLTSGFSLTFGRMTLDELYQSAKKDCGDIPDLLYCPLDDDVFGGCDMQNLENVSRSSIISKVSKTIEADRISSQHTILSTEPRRYIDFNVQTLLFTKRYPLVILFIFSTTDVA